MPETYPPAKHAFDTRYVLINKREACQILGMPSTSFDRARKEDPSFPVPITQGKSANAPLRFVLGEVYAYSEMMITQYRESEGQSPKR